MSRARYLIVVCAPTPVRKDLVRVQNLLEFCCGFDIVGITVGMIAKHRLAIRPFDFFLASAALDP